MTLTCCLLIMAAGVERYLNLLQVYMAASPLPQLPSRTTTLSDQMLRPLFQVEAHILAKYRQRQETTRPADFIVKFQLPNGQLFEETVKERSRGFVLLQLVERRLPDRTRAPILSLQGRVLSAGVLATQPLSELGVVSGSTINIAYR